MTPSKKDSLVKEKLTTKEDEILSGYRPNNK